MIISLLLSSFVATGVPLQGQKTFGHSVKNGRLPPDTEVTAFEHSCNDPPCVITHMNIPAVYPPHMNQNCNWSHAVLSFYVDDDPAISVTLFEFAGESTFSNATRPNARPVREGIPWGIDLMGRTAQSGGFYSTVRIPFQTSIRIAMEANNPCNNNNNKTEDMMMYWMVVRGLEAHRVVVGDLELPKSAKLQVARVSPTPVQELQMITLASSPKGTSGALLRVQWTASGPSFSYLEACLRLVTPIEGNPKPIFLSSGAEDFFLGASYFDAGRFQNPNSGLTFFDVKGHKVGVYKTHTHDPVVFQNGFRLVFRNMEHTGGCGDTLECCPDKYCPQTENDDNLEQQQDDRARKQRDLVEHGEAAIYSSLVWYYVWNDDDEDNAKESDEEDRIAQALARLAELKATKSITDDQEDMAVDRLLMDGDKRLAALLTSYAESSASHLQTARILTRYLEKV